MGSAVRKLLATVWFFWRFWRMPEDRRALLGREVGPFHTLPGEDIDRSFDRLLAILWRFDELRAPLRWGGYRRKKRAG